MVNKIKYFKKIRRLKRIQKNRELLNEYDRQGYHRELMNDSKLIWSVFTKHFQAGDKVFWLGHDNIHGLLHGQEVEADEKMVEWCRNSIYSDFWKRIDVLDFE